MRGRGCDMWVNGGTCDACGKVKLDWVGQGV